MSESRSRRVSCEISTGEGRPPFPVAGNRPIHLHWPRLAPHFQGTLLAPQRRSDGQATVWSWNEPAGATPPTGAELATLRRQLETALAAAETKLAPADDEQSRDTSAELVAAMQAIIGRLLRLKDAQLAAFVGRTESGLRVHSWGAAQPAVPFFPAESGYSVSGVILAGDTPAAGLEIVIENRKRVRLARTTSDAAGAFRFTQIASGSYRVLAKSERLDFPASGVELVVDNQSVSGLLLRSRSLNVATEAEPGLNLDSAVDRTNPNTSPVDDRTGDHRSRQAVPTRRRKFAAGFLVAGGAIGLATWGWLQLPARRAADPRPPAPTGQTTQGEFSERGADTPRMALGTGVGPAMSSANRGSAPGAALGAGASAAGVNRPQASGPRLSAVGRVELKGDDQDRIDSQRAGGGGTRVDPERGIASGQGRAGDALDAGRPASERPSDEVQTAVSPVNAAETALPPEVAPLESTASSGKERAPGASPASSPSQAPHVALLDSPAAASGRRDEERSERGGATEAAGKNDGAPGSARAAAGGGAALGSGGAVAGARAAAASPTGGAPTAGAPAGAQLSGSGADTAPGMRGVESPAASDRIEIGIRLRRWDTRLVRDFVLPTTVVKLGEADGIDDLRRAMLAELRQKIPVTLREFSCRYGLRLEIPLASRGAGALEWKTAAPGSARAGDVGVDAAEISFAAAEEPGPSAHSLCDASGRSIAEVRREIDGEIRISAPATAVCWFWVRVECSGQDESAADGKEASARFAWRSAPDLPLPAHWRHGGGGAAASAVRIDLPISPAVAPPPLALVDRLTGWAAVGSVDMRQLLPDGASSEGLARAGDEKSAVTAAH